MSSQQHAPSPVSKRRLPRKVSFLFEPTTVTRGKATRASTRSKTSPPPKTSKANAKPGPPAAAQQSQSKILRAIASSNPSSSSSTTISQQPSTPSHPSSAAARKPPPLINDFHPVRARMSPQLPETPLPSNYKKVANKVTMVIVAMPILLVTSWVLYERLVLGEERKLLVQPAAVEGKREKREL